MVQIVDGGWSRFAKSSGISLKKRTSPRKRGRLVTLAYLPWWKSEPNFENRLTPISSLFKVTPLPRKGVRINICVHTAKKMWIYAAQVSMRDGVLAHLEVFTRDRFSPKRKKKEQGLRLNFQW